MRSLAVAATLVTLSTTAFAQAPGMTQPQYGDDEAPASQPPRPLYQAPVYEAPAYQYPMMPAPELPPAKSEGTATMLSIGATAAGFALIAGGANHDSEGTASLGLLTLIVGPSLGHIYAGETSHAVGMSLLRGGAFLAFVAGFAKTVSVADCFDCGSSYRNDKDDGERLMWIGGVTFVAATVYDIMDASRAARRTNDKSRRVMMMPTVVNMPSGPAPAVGFSGKF